VANVEQLHRNKEYQPRPREFEGLLDRICIFHPQGKNKTWDCDQLQGFTDEVLKMDKKDDQEKKLEDSKCNFPEAHTEVNYIYGGLDSSMSRRSRADPGLVSVILQGTRPGRVAKRACLLHVGT
jgi:hypothetical protein